MEDRIKLDPAYSGQGPMPSNPVRPGSPYFYALLERAAEMHARKSHDYASQDNPSGNYHFAGHLALLFSHSESDAGFIGRIGEKIYRLANLERFGKKPLNESVEDTELDIVTITCLWMADRQARRAGGNPLEKELFDLIYRMPDEQREKIVSFIRDIQAAKKQRIAGETRKSEGHLMGDISTNELYRSLDMITNELSKRESGTSPSNIQGLDLGPKR